MTGELHGAAAAFNRSTGTILAVGPGHRDPILLTANIHSWRNDATCQDLSPAESDRIFFPAGNGVAEAKAYCAVCPVSTDCASWADRNRIPYGVFAGEPAHLRRDRLGIAEFEYR